MFRTLNLNLWAFRIAVITKRKATILRATRSESMAHCRHRMFFFFQTKVSQLKAECLILFVFIIKLQFDWQNWTRSHLRQQAQFTIVNLCLLSFTIVKARNYRKILRVTSANRCSRLVNLSDQIWAFIIGYMSTSLYILSWIIFLLWNSLQRYHLASLNNFQFFLML